MRKHGLMAAMAAACMVLVCSCVREKNFETFALDPDAVSFVLTGVATRSADADPVQVNTYSLGTDDAGHLFTLNETVMDMGAVGADSPATRGTPAFTENVQDVYGSSFNGVLYGASGEVVGDGSFEAMEDGIRWRRVFGFDPWQVSDPLMFFLRMPASPTGLSNIAYDRSNGSISFDYETPETAADQQDILFASREISDEAYKQEAASNGGAGVLFRHALTGIKFALSSARNSTTADGGRTPDGEVATFITKVEFVGLRDKGSAVFLPKGTETTTDNKEEYSSDKSFTWTLDGTSTKSFSQTYGEDDIQDYDQDDAADAVHGPESFYASGQNRNLNKDDASLTFWFIPQEMTADVKLNVTFYVWNGQSKGEEITLQLALGQVILDRASENNKSWKAGQLRTFTLDPTLVDVAISDDVSEDGLVKDNVEILNTGNKDAYIRVAIVGNWVDKATGEILMGTLETTSGNEQVLVPITPWSETDTTQGTFVGLGGGGAWVKKSDGFWYFKQIVPPGKMPGETSTGGTSVPLFESYTRRATPPAEGAGLVLELVVQAVDAAAGTTYEAAWASVL